MDHLIIAEAENCAFYLLVLVVVLVSVVVKLIFIFGLVEIQQQRWCILTHGVEFRMK